MSEASNLSRFLDTPDAGEQHQCWGDAMEQASSATKQQPQQQDVSGATESAVAPSAEPKSSVSAAKPSTDTAAQQGTLRTADRSRRHDDRPVRDDRAA